MKVKMTEHYQDATVHLSPEQEADVDNALGAWLVEHRKAVALESKSMTFEEFTTPVILENVTNVETVVVDEPHTEEKPKGDFVVRHINLGGNDENSDEEVIESAPKPKRARGKK